MKDMTLSLTPHVSGQVTLQCVSSAGLDVVGGIQRGGRSQTICLPPSYPAHTCGAKNSLNSKPLFHPLLIDKLNLP